MNITFVLAVYNNIEITKECYKILRSIYPEVPLVISSGGSTDGTFEWGSKLKDRYTTFSHINDRITFSETYNKGIALVKTEKLVLIHNDMVIGRHFLENIDKNLQENMILSYTTIEPPIFKSHVRPGKVIEDFGLDFKNFNQKSFDEYVEEHKENCNLYPGAVFFMSMYKKVFDDIGGFDEINFIPCFCEDDDFLFRAKLKGYSLKTTDCAIVYHFVSLTSRYSDEMKDKTFKYELDSNKNFLRKWGIPSHVIHSFNFLSLDDIKYERKTMSLILTDETIFLNNIFNLEPCFDKIYTPFNFDEYIKLEQPNTKFDLKTKFISNTTDSIDTDIVIKLNNIITLEDIDTIHKSRLLPLYYQKGKYVVGNLEIYLN